MKIVRLHECTPHELFELDRKKTIVFIPIAGLEDRGAHIPLNFDQLKIEQQIQDLANALESKLSGWAFLICPLLSGSVDGVNSTYTFHFRPHIIRDWTVDLIHSLKDLGFIQFISITGTTTPKNLTALEDVEKLVSRKWGIYVKKSPLRYISLSSGMIQKSIPITSLMFSDRSEHGGTADTSFMLRFFPNQLRESWKSFGATAIPKTPLDRLRNYISGRRIGNWGSAPNLATATTAEATHQFEIQKMSDLVQSWLNGTSNRSTFRSWYSVIPHHKSFAKSWLISGIIFIIFVVWLYLGL